MKEALWLDRQDLVALHEKLLALHGGGTGIRDLSLLESALARPQQHLSYSEFSDILDLAAAYTTGIVHNHPLVDGNKRVGFVAGVLFLELNGWRFTATEEEAAAAVLALAAGTLNDEGYTKFLRAQSSPTG
ncbi:MAG: type II toxin-antitoxin system death-on-curing family toxin [bacterium]